jgi:hypothetical protein
MDRGTSAQRDIDYHSQRAMRELDLGFDAISRTAAAALGDTGLSDTAMSAIREAYDSVRAGHDKASQLKHSMQGAQA